MRTIISGMSLLLLLPASAWSQSFGAFITQLNHAGVDERPSRAAEYLDAHPFSPLYDDETTAVFVYMGAARSVSIAGDMNGWAPDADMLTSVSGTDLWYAKRTFERDARLDYKFVIDHSSWILDPRNPHTSSGGFGENSEIRMPGYADHPELIRDETIPHGSILDTVIHGRERTNDRRIVLYIPPGYESGDDSLGLIIVHDGPEFVELAGMTNVLDNLISEKKIPPVVGLFIPPVDRTEEYAGDRMGTFASFVANEVIPFVRAHYRIHDDPAHHVVMGASNGGNISLYMGMTYPDLFGNIAAFSSNVVPRLAEQFASDKPLPLRFYLDLGTYDIPLLLPRVRGLRDILQRNGYEVRYAEHHDGHSWANWRTHIDDALIFLLSAGE